MMVNVHAFIMRVRLLKGKNSGIGIVIRDHRDMIVKMYSGTIRN